MKKTNIIGALCALMLTSTAAYGNSTCMMNKPYNHTHDFTKSQYVQCYCPCRQYKRLPHGECSYCAHYRYIDEVEILTPQQTKSTKAATPRIIVNKKLHKLFGEKEFHAETQRFTQNR